MASIATKSSVLALKEETTEGTPIAPSSASDYLAIQPDAAMAPSFETLTNDELRASIGASKPILGLEAPTFTMSHYLRHSGVEGQAPNYRLFLKAMLGTEVVQGTEYDTVSGSTVSALNVNTGEGANFRRGQPLLIKDATNGYRIRCVKSVSGDALTMSFNVPNAPASGVNLGKAVSYHPANSGHPSLTVWHYLGNGGARQMMAGSRVVSMSATADAGQLVNASYSLEGVSYYKNSIEITASTDTLDFNDGTDRVATVPAGWYKDPVSLAAALQTAMNAAGSSDEFTVTYSHSTGKFTIATDGTTLNLEWSTGTNTAQTIGGKLGFLTAADDTGSTSYTSDNAQVLVAPHSPSYDAADPLSAKNHEVMLGDATDFVCFDASSISWEIATPKTNINSICSASGVKGSVINERTVTFSVTALLNQYDVKNFYKFANNQETSFQYSFGEKLGGNWIPGKCGAFYIPTATISSYEIADQDGLVILNLELSAFVNGLGQDEVALGFV